LVPDKPRHYIRLTPSDPRDPFVTADPDNASFWVANGGGLQPARNVVSGDFLQLVRLGIRAPDDPLIRDSIEVIDAVLRHDLPQGPCWLRYNHDAYGQKADGGAFDGSGVGGCWPLLTGERGHYELAAGRDPLPFIGAMEAFSNAGSMLPEQVWFGPSAAFKRGAPTGSAMPLCWAHAEYLSLVRSRAAGEPFDRIAPAFDRYVRQGRRGTELAIWTFAHRLTRMPPGKTLRIITAEPAVVRWSAQHGARSGEVAAASTALGLFFVDLPTRELLPASEITFQIDVVGSASRETHRLTVTGD
jgi:glucoamylase